MKKSNTVKRGPQDSSQAPALPDKMGWIRKFCGRGIFREIWRNRFVMLKGDLLYISEKEAKDEKKIQEVYDLADYERSEELRKSKSRSKKNHSKLTVQRSRQPGNTVPNLIFLAVSPEEKESWINALNGAITRAKNRILDEVTVEEESLLAHPTRDRAKIPHTRRLPTRGHLMAVASTSTSDGMLTLDLIQEEDAAEGAAASDDTCERSFRVDLDKSMAMLTSGRKRSDTDVCRPVASGEPRGKSGSLPRKSELSWSNQERTGSEKSRCASMDEILSHSDSRIATTTSQVQDLISRKLERTRELLAEVRAADSPASQDSAPEGGCRAEAERLLQEAECAWGQACQVLAEVKELQELYRKLDLSPSKSLSPTKSEKLGSPQSGDHRRSLM